MSITAVLRPRPYLHSITAGSLGNLAVELSIAAETVEKANSLDGEYLSSELN